MSSTVLDTNDSGSPHLVKGRDLFADGLIREIDEKIVNVGADFKVTDLRALVNWIRETLYASFEAGMSPADLVHAKAYFVDKLLITAWRHFFGEHADKLTLVASGGYGRGELLPHSDVDLLLVIPDGELGDCESALQLFLTFLWDIGLEVGHSVRTVSDCTEQARADLTVMTNMLETRFLTGNKALFASMQSALADKNLWPVADFFHGKKKEQEDRHEKFEDTAYKLEPNVKESPGGLRDIQTIAWVAKRHFSATTLHDLVDHGFLNEEEYVDLISGQSFLWRVRFALHMLTNRREDRLLFDHQLKVASMFGYSDKSQNLAVEQFMQRYYRTIKSLSCLNDLLLQLFEEAIVHAEDDTPPVPINRRFQARHGYIEVTHEEVFQQNPFALLEIFYLLQQDRTLTGIRAETLRLIRCDRHLIDGHFRDDIRARSFFMEIIRAPQGLTRALRRMNRYGVLGRYVPDFGQVIGRMQYDLFHTLTVDEHTIFVVRNLRRLAIKRFEHELPFASEVMSKIPKPELLYMAGFFHDMGKGHGGDHSEIGADLARVFCLQHGLSGYDSELVAWLVNQHLLMSMTAQRMDISDPDVIHEFAVKVGDLQHLDYLFLLTVSDIRATNPKLWNSWRESLLINLYQSTRRSLERGLDDPIQEKEIISESQSRARKLLQQRNLPDKQIDDVWKRFPQDSFRRFTPDEIATYTEGLAHLGRVEDTLVLVEPQTNRGTSVFVYTRDVDYLFGLLTGVLAQMGLNILDARISATVDNYTLDSYVVAEEDGRAVLDKSRISEIESRLISALKNPESNNQPVSRQASRQARHFAVPTQVHFQQDEERNRTIMELVTADRPGLLSTVGDVFRQHKLLVQDAKIGTIGERAEDVFYITTNTKTAIKDESTFHQIRHELARALDYELETPTEITL